MTQQAEQSWEVRNFTLPVSMREAAIALEDNLPAHLNAIWGGDAAIAAITDRMESLLDEPFKVIAPEADQPIMGLTGDDGTEAEFDSWLAKGTILHRDGSHSVFVAVLDVMRRPWMNESWYVGKMVFRQVEQTVESYLAELEAEKIAA